MTDLSEIIQSWENHVVKQGLKVKMGFAKIALRGKRYEEIPEIMQAVNIAVLKVGETEDIYGVFGSDYITEADVINRASKGESPEKRAANEQSVLKGISLGVKHGYLAFYQGNGQVNSLSAYSNISERPLKLTRAGRDVYDAVLENRAKYS